MKHKYLSVPSTLPPKRKTTKYPIALFNPPSHDGGYHNGGYCIPARGALGCRSSATGTVARMGRLARGHLGRSALQNGWSVAGAFFRPGQLRNCEIRGCSSIKRSGCFCGRGRPRAWPDLARAVVAALVRAQKIRLSLKILWLHDQAWSGPYWASYPTLRLSVFAVRNQTRGFSTKF